MNKWSYTGTNASRIVKHSLASCSFPPIENNIPMPIKHIPSVVQQFATNTNFLRI